MNFKSILSILLVSYVITSSGCQPANRSGETVKKPNILFCFADDWGQYASCYADPNRETVNDVVITPTIDKLAREGVLFNHAYMNDPSCTPSRASVATGCYFWRCGKSANLQGGTWEGIEDPGNRLTGFGTLLDENGYHMGRTYKCLETRWFPGEIYQNSGMQFCQYSQTMDTAKTMAVGHEYLKDEVLANFSDFMSKKKVDQPFCYVWGPHNPHRPWIRGSGKRIWDIEPDDLKGKMPGHLPDVHEVREDFADYLGEIQAWDRGIQYLLEELKAMGELENTLIVLAGDNGIPGFPRGKCNLYDFGVRSPLIISGKSVPHSNRKVDDFVNLIDLAPTFLEMAGIIPPEEMDGKSLVPLLQSKREGQIDKLREYAVVGRETHVAGTREGNLPYPSRAIHTKDYIYIRNFKPERSPLGSIADLSTDSNYVDYELLAGYKNPQQSPFKDMDNSPTKAWVMTHRNDPAYSKYFDLAFGLRPGEELYDLNNDPDQLNNVADDQAYEQIRETLSAKLMGILKETGDPRLEDIFDLPPYVRKD